MHRIAAALLLAASLPALAAPEADLWERWTAHGDSAQPIDHSAWDDWLETYVRSHDDGVNRVAYGSVSAADRQRLDAYLDQLQALPVSQFPRDQQFAYWVNLYNALTVQVVLEHYPVKSIRRIGISPGLFTRGPWGAKLATVEGEALSLDDIEHRILRPIWQDPRVHYAVNCAAIGCPNLQPRAFTADNLETLLESGAHAFVNHPRGARVDGDRLTVSSIYEWFKADFGGTDAGVIAHLQQYAEPPLRRKLAGVSRIARHRYDWALNE